MRAGGGALRKSRNRCAGSPIMLLVILIMELSHNGLKAQASIG